MQKAFGLVEILSVFMLIGILFLFIKPIQNNQLHRSMQYLYQNILYAKNLALTHHTTYTNLTQSQWIKNMFTSIDQNILITDPMFWQMQFHLGGKYTKHSFSIYFDTPRFAQTTHYDNRPMAGDLIAIQGKNLRCISGYNNTNISDFCKNNAETTTRLSESFGVTLKVFAQASCFERQTARIYFDFLGKPYCGKFLHPLIEPFVIILSQNNNALKICILPKSGAILKGKKCEKI